MIEKTTSNKDIIFIYQKDKGILCSSCINNPIDIITEKSRCIKPKPYILLDTLGNIDANFLNNEKFSVFMFNKDFLDSLEWQTSLSFISEEHVFYYFLIQISTKNAHNSPLCSYGIFLLNNNSDPQDSNISSTSKWFYHFDFGLYGLTLECNSAITGIYPLNDLMNQKTNKMAINNNFDIVLD